MVFVLNAFHYFTSKYYFINYKYFCEIYAVIIVIKTTTN